MHLADFDYPLPPDLIAQTPAPVRDAARLLVVRRDGLDHTRFDAVSAQLRAGDLLVLNDTRVIRARLYGEKDSGGHAELLVERIEQERVALCQARVSKPLQAGRAVRVGVHRLEVLGRKGDFYRLLFPVPVLTLLETCGTVPLPPYITRAAADIDADRYQTVYAARPGAVAAPTAGLHFTPELLGRLQTLGVELATVTLHVGAGTFQPVRTDDLSGHRMHHEWFEVNEAAVAAIERCRSRGGRVVAVGTTVVRTLESALDATGTLAARSEATDLFITPGYRFRVVDALLTNFHLPKSTLLMLVTAFGGYARVMAAYRAAVDAGYRFFSYGDAMYLERCEEGEDARL